MSIMTADKLYPALLDMLNITAYELEKSAGLSKGSVGKAIKRKSAITKGTQELIMKAYPGINPEYISGESDEPFPDPAGKDSDFILAEPAIGFQRNARMLGTPVDVHTPKSGINYIETSEGYYIMYAPHVTIRARAGFQGGGYSDPVFVESLPKYPMTVNTIHKGNYFVFDVGGDSMNDGSIRSIPDGSKVLGREIKLDLWRSRFHYNEYPYFIIVTDTDDGLLCKEIVAHDVEKGIIRVRSLNPNKKMFPDFDVHLNNCLMICNIVKKELPANI